MALQASGAISTADIAAEMGLSTSAAFNTSNPVLKGMAGASSSGVFNIYDLYSKVAREVVVPKTVNMTIGTWNNGSDYYYGYSTSVGGGFGSMSSYTIDFSNGQTGTFDQIQFANTIISNWRCIVADSSGFVNLAQMGIKFTFDDGGSTHVINGTDGGAFNSLGTHYTIGGLPIYTSWLQARVGQTVSLTMEPIR